MTSLHAIGLWYACFDLEQSSGNTHGFQRLDMVQKKSVIWLMQTALIALLFENAIIFHMGKLF